MMSKAVLTQGPPRRGKKQKSELSVYTDSSAPLRTSGGDGFSKFFLRGPVPPRKMVTLPYVYNSTLTAGSSNVFGTEVIFRLNSIYDPLYSGAGTYPNGYAAWSGFYADYRVHQVMIDLTFTDPSADGMIVGALVQYSNDTFSLGGNSIATADALQRSDIRPLNNTGEQTVRISRKFNLWDCDGNTRLQWLANPGYQAVFGQNPTLTPFLRIAVASLPSATPTCSVLVRLTFYAELFDRINLTT
jgi:hypothetical protein